MSARADGTARTEGAGVRPAPGARAAEVLRRSVVVLGAAALLVLPQFATNASFFGVPGLPGPLAVLGLGLGLWLMPVLLVAAWVAGGRAWLVQPGLAVPVGLFILGGVVSTLSADDKASAMVRAAEMTGLWAAFWALVQAVRTDAERRFVLATLLASATVSAALAIEQVAVGLPTTWEYFQANRLEVLARQGIEPGSWMEKAFVDRFTGGVQASLGHPNVLAALLVLAAIVGCGFVREKWAEAGTRGARGLTVLVAAATSACGGAVFLTQSRGGVAALVAGLYVLGVAWGVRRRGVRIALYAAPLAAGAAAIALAAWIDHPATADALRTLRFRLDYWTATGEILKRHGWTGVGLENFGLHYLQHKVPHASEEVRDPHNLLLSTWSQLGVAGLAALVSLAVLAVRAWRRGAAPASAVPGAGAGPANGRRTGGAGASGQGAGGRDGRGLAALLLPTAALAAPAVIGCFLLGWPMGIVAMAAVAMIIALASGEDPLRMEVSDRPLRSLGTACVVALAAFVLMEQIGTAVLEPPTAWAMLAVLGMSLGGGGSARRVGVGPWGAAAGPAAAGSPAAAAAGGAPDAPAEPAAPGVALPAPVKFLLILAAMGLAFAYARWLVFPVGREQACLRALGRTDDVFERDEVLREAASAHAWAWEPAMIRGRLWQDAFADPDAPVQGLICLERAMEAYREAVGRQPRLRRAWLGMASCRLTLDGALDDPGALAEALLYVEEAARLYPTDLVTRLRLADLLDRLGDERRAADEYLRVLDLDRRMPDPYRRLKEEVRAAVEARVAALYEVLAAWGGTP